MENVLTLVHHWVGGRRLGNAGLRSPRTMVPGRFYLLPAPVLPARSPTRVRCKRVFTFPDFDSYADADTDSCTRRLQWMSMEWH